MARESILICPVCAKALVWGARQAKCHNGHDFDVAREGYLNLLGSGDRRKRDPGDNREMVQARHRFIGKGYFDRAARAISEVVAGRARFVGADLPKILDVGAGEGFYLRALTENLRSGEFYGVDISRNAVKVAAKNDRNKKARWLVANAKSLPFADRGIHVLLSCFARREPQEFRRVLDSRGALVVVGPGSSHLAELRAAIYTSVHALPEERDRLSLARWFKRADDTRIKYVVAIENDQDARDLLVMTPYLWRAERSKAGQLSAAKLGRVTVEMLATVWCPK